MTQHSRLGPSGAHRWMVCPGSVNAERIVRAANPNADESSPYAEEGTRAHELAERLLLNPELPLPDDDIETMDDTEMLRHCLRYREYCQNVAGSSANTFVEERVTMPKIHKDCFGTADFVAYRREYKHLHIVDLKYGSGQFVDAERNPQAMMYAEGARQMIYDKLGENPRYFTVHIYQPRLRTGENIGSYQFKNTELDDFVTLAHQAAIDTETEQTTFNPGDKQCHWCLANPCKARESQMYTLLAGKFDDLDDAVDDLSERSPLMDDAELARWLKKASALKSFIARVEAMAYDRAMDRTEIPGFKLVQGRGSYKPNTDALEFILGDIAFTDPKPRSMTDLKRVIGAKRFAEVAMPYYKKVPGKPALVPASDPRLEWSETSDIEGMLDDL